MADVGKAPEGFPRLMQAARALSGLTIDQLAERLTEERALSARNLRSIENGRKGALTTGQRRAILDACGLAPSVSLADLTWVQDLDAPLERLPDQVKAGYRPIGLIGRACDALVAKEGVGREPTPWIIGKGEAEAIKKRLTRIEAELHF